MCVCIGIYRENEFVEVIRVNMIRWAGWGREEEEAKKKKKILYLQIHNQTRIRSFFFKRLEKPLAALLGKNIKNFFLQTFFFFAIKENNIEYWFSILMHIRSTLGVGIIRLKNESGMRDKTLSDKKKGNFGCNKPTNSCFFMRFFCKKKSGPQAFEKCYKTKNGRNA